MVVSEGEASLCSKVMSFVLHGRIFLTLGLNCCDHPLFYIMSKVFFHQSGQSPKIIRAKVVGLERTDSQTVGEFPRGRRKGTYTPSNCLCVWNFFDLCIQHFIHLHAFRVKLWDLSSYHLGVWFREMSLWLTNPV